MKSALLILLCVLGAGYFILFYEISKVSAEGGNGQLSKSMRLDSPIENYPCDDKDIIIEIDEIPLKLPRHKTDILFNNGTKLDGLSEVPFMCDIKIFKNAARIRRPHFFKVWHKQFSTCSQKRLHFY